MWFLPSKIMDSDPLKPQDFVSWLGLFITARKKIAENILSSQCYSISPSSPSCLEKLTVARSQTLLFLRYFTFINTMCWLHRSKVSSPGIKLFIKQHQEKWRHSHNRKNVVTQSLCSKSQMQYSGRIIWGVEVSNLTDKWFLFWISHDFQVWEIDTNKIYIQYIPVLCTSFRNLEYIF